MPEVSRPDPGAPETTPIHATAIAVAGRGVLIRGPSGSGKSDLALRCLWEPCGPGHRCLLIADDRVILRSQDAQLIAECPSPLRGCIEVRGLGIIALPCLDSARIHLVADLVPALEPIERLPPSTDCITLLGLPIPSIRLHPFEASAPLKLLLALTAAAA